MKSRALTENLTQLTRWHFVNAFLVREDDGFTLVDTTLGGGAAALIGAAKKAGGAIRRIALTHGHGDHVGSLDALKERLGGSVEVLVPELDARILAGDKVVEGKLPGSWPRSRRCRTSCFRAAIGSVASRSWQARVTVRATFRSSTRATAR